MILPPSSWMIHTPRSALLMQQISTLTIDFRVGHWARHAQALRGTTRSMSHIKLLVYSGALSPLLTLSPPLEDNFMFLLLGHKCPTVVYFGALHLSRILKSLKVCSAEARNLSSAIEYAGLNYKERQNHLKLLPLMQLADIMFQIQRSTIRKTTGYKHEIFGQTHTRSSDRLTLKHVRCESNF